MWIFQIQACEGGVASAIAGRAASAHLTYVIFKVADGTTPSNDPQQKADLRDALRTLGIQCWGYHYVYGDDPATEAAVAIQEVGGIDLDGLVVDAEIQYENKSQSAQDYMAKLRGGLHAKPIAFSSFKYPTQHPNVPWREFLTACDIAMPQVYWEDATGPTDPGDQLQRAINEYRGISDKPIVPTGSAYKTDSWTATPSQIAQFLQSATTLGLPSVNFWDWDFAGRPDADMQALWNAISAFFSPISLMALDRFALSRVSADLGANTESILGRVFDEIQKGAGTGRTTPILFPDGIQFIKLNVGLGLPGTALSPGTPTPIVSIDIEISGRKTDSKP